MNSAIPNLASECDGVKHSDVMAKIFPLQLSPFEHYMFMDDRDDYPMIIVLMVELEGSVQREAFEESLRLAIVRHPLLSSLVQQIPGNGKCWVPVTDSTLDLTWVDCHESIPDAHQRRIDLTRQSGLRIRAHVLPDRCRIDFHFHHASADGIGGIQFIGDVLAIYGRLTAPVGAELPELTPISIEKLLTRTKYVTEESEAEPKAICCPWRLGKKLLKLLRRGPTPVAVRQDLAPTSAESRQAPAMICRFLERSVIQKLKVVAAQKGVGLNDLYLLGMFQSINEWNQQLERSNPRQWLRIGMPTSLRTPLHDGMPATNLVSYMFLTRRTSDLTNPDKMLSDIHRQTSSIVNDRLGRFFVNGLRHVLRIPCLLNGLLKLNGCFASAIMSNVGDTRRQFTAQFPLKQGRCVAGNLVLMAIKGSAPVRPNTRISTTTGLYAGNLYIHVNFDRTRFTKEQAEQFADRFVERLRQFAPAEATLEAEAA